MGAAIKHDSTNLQLVRDGAGFARLTQLLQWTALTFSHTDLSAALPLTNHSLTDGMGVLGSDDTGARLQTQARLSGSGHLEQFLPPLPVAPEVAELFAVLSSILGFHQDTAGNWSRCGSPLVVCAELGCWTMCHGLGWSIDNARNEVPDPHGSVW